jgi:hypothetical protein
MTGKIGKKGYLGDGQDYGRGCEDGRQANEGPAYLDGFIKGFAERQTERQTAGRRQKMSEKENGKAKLEKYRANWKVEWLAELDHSLDRLYCSEMQLMAKLRLVEFLIHKLQTDAREADILRPCLPNVDECETRANLDVIKKLIAESIHQIDQDKSDVIDKLLIDLTDEKQIQETKENARPTA